MIVVHVYHVLFLFFVAQYTQSLFQLLKFVNYFKRLLNVYKNFAWSKESLDLTPLANW